MRQRIRVHWNLHRGGLSVTVGGKVVETPARICLHDVRFLVSDASLARMRKLGRRKVVAWVEGTRCCDGWCDVLPGEVVTFNPWRSDRFHLKESGAPVTEASDCTIESVPAPTKTGNAPLLRARGVR